MPQSKTLMVVNDEGFIYQLSTKGDILQKKYLGDFDFEGIARYKNNLLVVVENKNAIFVLDTKSLKILKKIPLKKNKDVKKSKKYGLEGITVVHGTLYLAHQTSGLLRVQSLKKKARVKRVYKQKDLSGLSFYENYLYMTNDKKNLLMKYDIHTNTLLKTYKLKKSAQEGVCFDGKNNVYIADDNGYILKYKTKKLGL